MVNNNISTLMGLTDAWQFLNTETTGLFGISLLVMTFIITFFIVKVNFEAKRAFASATFLTFILAVWLRAIVVINTYVLVVTVCMLILSFLWLKYAEEG